MGEAEYCSTAPYFKYVTRNLLCLNSDNSDGAIKHPSSMTGLLSSEEFHFINDGL